MLYLLLIILEFNLVLLEYNLCILIKYFQQFVPLGVILGANNFNQNNPPRLYYSNYFCVVRTSHTMIQEQPSKQLPSL